jgi:predicted O-methyltransferase YrrM
VDQGSAAPEHHRDDDVRDAESVWGELQPRRVFGAGDLVAAIRRLPLAAALAREVIREPATLRVAMTAIRLHHALQKPLELIAYLRFVRARRIERVLEIGALWGGMVFAHAAVASSSAHLIAIDKFPRESADAMTARLRALVRPSQRVTCLWQDSHEPATAAGVRAALDGPLDLLFLDGDHSADGIARDFALYEPLVRSGGLIALHDIDARTNDDVPAFWRATRERYEHIEIVDRRHAPQGLGVGILIK